MPCVVTIALCLCVRVDGETLRRRLICKSPLDAYDLVYRPSRLDRSSASFDIASLLHPQLPLPFLKGYPYTLTKYSSKHDNPLSIINTIMSEAFEKGATTGTKTYNEETSVPEHASSAVRVTPFF